MTLRYTFYFCTIVMTVSIITFLVLNIEAIAFSTVNKVELLVNLQKEVIDNISSYTSYIPQSKRRIIERYISLSQVENTMALENVTQFLASPVNGYILVKRLTRDLHIIEDILKNHTGYKRNYSLLHYPTDTDFRTAVAQIVLMIYVYEINVKEFTDGNFTRKYRRNSDKLTVFSLPMTSSDCYEVATKAFEIKEYDMAADWFGGAILQYDTECRDGGCFYNDSIKLNNLEIRKQLSLELYFARHVLEYESNSNWGDIAEDPTIIKGWPFLNNFLCQAEVLPQKRLYCQYQYGPHPFLRLARLKIEFLHIEPNIMRYLDVISDEESEVLKNIAMNQINSNISDCVERASALRNTVLIDDHVSRVAAVVSRRSLDISGLTNVMAPGINIIHYGPAGFFSSHLDSISTYEIHDDNPRCLHKITAQATVQYFLSEPELGGFTTFPALQLSVFPLKNSALLWRTLLPSHEEDLATVHASCPVLYGSKWTALKWMSHLEDVQSTPEHLLTSDEFLKFKPLSYKAIRRRENK